MTDRIIPLADAPAPASEEPEAAPAAAAPAAPIGEGAFTPDPLNTLKFQPALVEAEPHGEPGALVEVDGLGEVPDGEQDVVEAEQFVRLFV